MRDEASVTRLVFGAREGVRGEKGFQKRDEFYEATS